MIQCFHPHWRNTQGTKASRINNEIEIFDQCPRTLHDRHSLSWRFWRLDVIWRNGVHSSCTVPEICRICAEVNWSSSGNSHHTKTLYAGFTACINTSAVLECTQVHSFKVLGLYLNISLLHSFTLLHHIGKDCTLTPLRLSDIFSDDNFSSPSFLVKTVHLQMYWFWKVITN